MTPFRPFRLSLTAALILLGGLPLLATPVVAQRAPAEQAADSLVAQQRWTEAAKAFKALTDANPASGANWALFGESELQLKHFEPAAAAFARAAELKYRPFKSLVDQARVRAASGDEAAIYPLLQKVAEGPAGGALRSYILGATEFAPYLTAPRFVTQMAAMKACVAPVYRQFDFWIGDWDVYGAQGGLAGHNLVTAEQDGCVLVEHWTSARGGQTGTSFNYYDIRDKQWHQLYLDNSGNAGSFPAMAGTLTDGRIVMLTDDVNNTLSRWTWYEMEPGKVKQMQEVSNDHGTTWQTVWNSVYVRRKG